MFIIVAVMIAVALLLVAAMAVPIFLPAREKGREKLQKLVDTIKSKSEERDTLLAKDGGMVADDVTKARALNGEIKSLHEQYELIEASETLKAWQNEPANRIPLPGVSSKDADTLGFRGAGHTEIGYDERGSIRAIESVGAGTYGIKQWQEMGETPYKQAFFKYMRKGERGLSSPEIRSLEVGLDEQGGYTAPPEMLARLIQRTPAPTRVAGMVTNITTSRSAIVMPKVNYSADDIFTTGFRVTWTGENANEDEHDVDTDNLFGTHRIDVYTAMLSTSVTNDMVEDNAFDLQGWLTSKFGETSDLLSDQMVLKGTGIGQPFGIFDNPGAVGQPAIVNSLDATKLTYDGLIDLDYALPEQYLNSGSLAYVMNRTNTARAIAKIKDGQQRSLFMMGGAEAGGLQGRRPDTLLGKPIAYSAFAPNVAADTTPIAYGDMSGYYRALRLGLTIQVLRETKAKRNMIEIVGRLRIGGKVVEPFKIKIQKVNATANA